MTDDEMYRLIAEDQQAGPELQELLEENAGNNLTIEDVERELEEGGKAFREQNKELFDENANYKVLNVFEEKDNDPEVDEEV